MPHKSILSAPAAARASRSISASFSAGMRFAMLAPRSLQRSATAAVSGCTAERHDKSIITRFVHNAVEKSVRKLIPLRVMLSVGFCILRRKLCLKIRNF